MTDTPEIPGPQNKLSAAMRTCGDPYCYQPDHLKKPYRGEPALLDLTDEELDGFIEALRSLRDGSDLRRRIDSALSESVDRCARCKICDNQVDAVMRVLGYG
jgi:hypothetical protein